MLFVYRLIINLYVTGVRLLAPFNAKARAWKEGRKNWARRLKEDIRPLRDRPVLWIHCASLGEFEQGRPIIEGVKGRWPETAILLTFYSPSGYEVRKDYPYADAVAYLPADTPDNAERFLQTVHPTLVIFVKYEFWYYHLRAVQQRSLPLLLVSALFRKDQLFFKPWGKVFRRLLQGFQHIFVQNQESAQLLDSIDITNYTVNGDTRIDRVGAIAQQARPFPEVEGWIAGAPCLIAGSTWPPDEELLSELLEEALPANWKCIIAPHKIEEGHLEEIEERFEGRTVRYSGLAEATDTTGTILIIDNIGILSSLYQYGRIAYVGGGFGSGIHNTLEPAAFGLPVIFGPRYQKFEEAIALIDRGGAFSVRTGAQLIDIFLQLKKEGRYQAASEEARGYIQQNQGVTREILDYLEREGFLHMPRV